MVLAEEEDMQTDEEASIMCGCKCGCGRWFHGKCVGYIPEEYEDLECDWFCPTCVRGCDTVY